MTCPIDHIYLPLRYGILKVRVDTGETYWECPGEFITREMFEIQAGREPGNLFVNPNGSRPPMFLKGSTLIDGRFIRQSSELMTDIEFAVNPNRIGSGQGYYINDVKSANNLYVHSGGIRWTIADATPKLYPGIGGQQVCAGPDGTELFAYGTPSGFGGTVIIYDDGVATGDETANTTMAVGKNNEVLNNGSSYIGYFGAKLRKCSLTDGTVEAEAEDGAKYRPTTLCAFEGGNVIIVSNFNTDDESDLPAKSIYIFDSDLTLTGTDDESFERVLSVDIAGGFAAVVGVPKNSTDPYEAQLRKMSLAGGNVWSVNFQSTRTTQPTYEAASPKAFISSDSSTIFLLGDLYYDGVASSVIAFDATTGDVNWRQLFASYGGSSLNDASLGLPKPGTHTVPSILNTGAAINLIDDGTYAYIQFNRSQIAI